MNRLSTRVTQAFRNKVRMSQIFALLKRKRQTDEGSGNGQKSSDGGTILTPAGRLCPVSPEVHPSHVEELAYEEVHQYAREMAVALHVSTRRHRERRTPETAAELRELAVYGQREHGRLTAIGLDAVQAEVLEEAISAAVAVLVITGKWQREGRRNGNGIHGSCLPN